MEYKNFVEFYYKAKLNNSKLYILSPVAIDSKFRADVGVLDSRIKILDEWNNIPTSFIDLLLYWIKRQLFFLENIEKSESCFQKFWIHIGVRNDIIFSGKYRNFLKLLSTFIYKIFPLKGYKTAYKIKYKSKLDVSPCQFDYDYIVFMRPDSKYNISIYNTYKTLDNKVITFIRNYDSVALKGIFTVKSDITIIESEKLKSLMVKLHRSYSYGKIVVLKKEFNSIDKLKKINILYCTSHPDFNKNEIKIVRSLVEIYRNYNFKVRVHDIDDKNKYGIDKEYFEGVSDYAIYKSSDGKVIKYHNLTTIKGYKFDLQNVHVLITISSTIVKDAYKFGINKIIYLHLMDDPYKFIFEREHIKILIKDCHIKVVRSLSEKTLLNFL